MILSDPFTPLFSQLGRTAAFLPPVDVRVSESDVVITMDVPGLTVEDLSIELVDDHLYVRGERKRQQLSEGNAWQHVERAFGRFERRIKVPDGVDPDAIMASIDNGVLSLIVPKPERMKPRAIEIGTGSGQRRIEATTA
jgi:HSP20 family protein